MRITGLRKAPTAKWRVMGEAKFCSLTHGTNSQVDKPVICLRLEGEKEFIDVEMTPEESQAILLELLRHLPKIPKPVHHRRHKKR